VGWWETVIFERDGAKHLLGKEGNSFKKEKRFNLSFVLF
jgi:hypothetical protein